MMQEEGQIRDQTIKMALPLIVGQKNFVSNSSQGTGPVSPGQTTSSWPWQQTTGQKNAVGSPAG